MRLRIKFQKRKEIIYTSALDLQKIWERSLRRACLEVKHSEGFHPQPKMQLAVPLPVGFEGRAELIDIWFSEIIPGNEVQTRMKNNLPEGIEILSIEEIPENQKALNGLAESAEFEVTINDPGLNFPNLKESMDSLLMQEKIERERNRKRYDLRPLILSINLSKSKDSRIIFYMKLLARSGATGRPDEVIKELGIDPASCAFVRTSINFNL